MYVLVNHRNNIGSVFIAHCCIFVYALHDLYIKLHSFNFTCTMVMKCLL